MVNCKKVVTCQLYKDNMMHINVLSYSSKLFQKCYHDRHISGNIKSMKIIQYLVSVCVAWGSICIVRAEDTSAGFPRITFTYDFNTPISTDGVYGPRLQLSSDNKYFGKDRLQKSKLTESIMAYTYGLGLGNYKLDVKPKNNNNMTYIYAILALHYQNQSYFEPFVGVYPGYAWSAEQGVFFNPVIGIDIRAFHFKRNWNSNLMQTYVQMRVEYNTLVSSLLFSIGLTLQFE